MVKGLQKSINMFQKTQYIEQLMKHNIQTKLILSFFSYVILSSLTITINSQPVLMTEQIGTQIFDENNYYLIYVYQQTNQKNLDNFFEYCSNRTDCAILNSTVQQYPRLRKFIGKKGKQYYLILNVPFEKKYVIDIDNKQFVSKSELKKFQQKYQNDKLDSFQASEHIPLKNSRVCTQLVGKTYNKFIKQQSVFKVIYTYTKNDACENCKSLLKNFKKLAKKMYNKQVLRFGYVDVYHNDIPIIPEPIVPHFYIYQGKTIVREVTDVESKYLSQIILEEVRRIMREIEGESDDDSSESTEDDL